MTVKIILFHQSKKNGEIPVYLQVIHNRTSRRFHTKVSVSPENWNPKTLEVKKTDLLNFKKNKKIREAYNKINDIKNLLENSNQKKITSFYEFVDFVIEKEKIALSQGTIAEYKSQLTINYIYGFFYILLNFLPSPQIDKNFSLCLL